MLAKSWRALKSRFFPHPQLKTCYCLIDDPIILNRILPKMKRVISNCNSRLKGSLTLISQYFTTKPHWWSLHGVASISQSALMQGEAEWLVPAMQDLIRCLERLTLVAFTCGTTDASTRPRSESMLYTRRSRSAWLHRQDPAAVVTKTITWEEGQENGLEISVTTVTLLSSALGQARYLLKAGLF